MTPEQRVLQQAANQRTNELKELVARAQTAFAQLTPSQKLRHRYMQRRSFTRGMGPDSAPYESHCLAVDSLMPHEAVLTDTQIGLILVGEPHAAEPEPHQ